MKIIPTRNFNDNVEFYIRKKKYKQIYRDIKTVTDELEKGNLVGNRLEGLKIPEGTAAYKVRIANSSTNVSKSHGFRLILLTIYSKKDDTRIPNDSQIELMIKNMLEPELQEVD